MSRVSLLYLGLVLAGALVVAIIVRIVVVRRRRASGSSTTIVSLTLSLAAFVAALSVFGALVTLGTTLTAQTVAITVPVEQYWPTLNPGVTIQAGPTATVIGGGFASADVSVDGLSTAARVTWALGQCLGLLVPAAVAALIAIVCFQLIRGAAFAPAVAKAATITAVIVLVGGLTGQLLEGIAGSMASNEILAISAWGAEGVADGQVVSTGWPDPVPFALTLDFWPIGAALGLGSLAAVFRYGLGLQRDSAGLV